MAYANVDFKNGGYVAAVAALHEGANFSLTLPNLEDWNEWYLYSSGLSYFLDLNNLLNQKEKNH